MRGKPHTYNFCHVRGKPRTYNNRLSLVERGLPRWMHVTCGEIHVWGKPHTYSFCKRSIAASSVASFLAKHSRTSFCPAGGVS